MKYQVKQINLTDEQIDEVNSSQSYPEFYSRYLRATNFPKKEGVVAAIEAGDYQTVAYITADSLEGVFDIGNVGPEENIERLAPMHSLSVGDIIVDEAGKAVYVDSFGFGEL